MNNTNVEAQVIAEAIAAFQTNYDLKCLSAMNFPCITMAGTQLTFYLILVTMELNNTVIVGQYPTAQTMVL